jgi:flagellar biosynthesis/type III secretory pathway chaperone
MELSWKQLMNVMDKLTAKVHRLITIAKDLHQAIIAEKVETIGRVVIDQEQEMKAFEDLEQERLALVSSLGTQFRLAPQQLTAAALQAHVPPAWSNDYRFQVVRLKQGMDELKQANQINQRLLQQSREFMSWLINYLVTPSGASALYDNAGISVQNSCYHVVNQNM